MAYQYKELNLYFTNEEGNQLVPEARQVYYNGNTPIEKVIVEQLLRGPGESGHYATLPSDTRIVGVSVADGIAYVNLGKQFVDEALPVDAQIPIYKKAGIATARYHMVDDLEGCRKFIDEVGYPVVVKPDNGVGASDTHKLSSDEELKRFLLYKSTYHPDLAYIMEEFVHAEVNSYDAIIDGSGNPIFEAGNVSPVSIMDIVNDNDNSIYYIIKDLPEDTRAAGRAAVKSFGVKSRFVHFEFFRMTEDQASMGKKGQIVALEVNMRPCGGFTPDMINFARSTNVYKIWADMIAFGGTDMPVGEHYYCPFAGRRDGKNFVYSHEQIMQKYQKNMRMVDRIPEALSGAMGNQMYVATFSTREEMEQFYSDVLAVNDPVNAKVQKELAEVLALGEPTTTALTEKPNLSPAVKPTTAVTKTPTRAVTKTARKRK